MRISGSEWAALKVAVRLPRALLDPRRLGPGLREQALTRRGLAAAALLAVALLAALHVPAAGGEVRRLTDAVAAMAWVRSVDARWNTTLALARTDAAAAPLATDVEATKVQRTLERVAAEADAGPQRTAAGALGRAMAEKGELLTRLERAAADSRQALAAIGLADAAVNAAIREAWGAYPQHERLIAAENLAVRVVAEARQYHHAPTASHRKLLQTYSAELARVQALPKALTGALARLEADAHRLLLLKPLEHMLGERVQALDTARGLNALADRFEAELVDALARRDRYAVALIVYALVLGALLIFGAVRAIARFRDLEALCEWQAAELEAIAERNPTTDSAPRVAELRRVDSDDDVRIISEHRRGER